MSQILTSAQKGLLVECVQTKRMRKGLTQPELDSLRDVVLQLKTQEESFSEGDVSAPVAPEAPEDAKRDLLAMDPKRMMAKINGTCPICQGLITAGVNKICHATAQDGGTWSYNAHEGCFDDEVRKLKAAQS